MVKRKIAQATGGGDVPKSKKGKVNGVAKACVEKGRFHFSQVLFCVCLANLNRPLFYLCKFSAISRISAIFFIFTD